MVFTPKSLMLSDLVSSNKIDQLPSNYIRPISQRPNLEQVSHDYSIPLIDLRHLYGPNRSHVVHKIGKACTDYGFFKVKNHGVPESTIANMMNIAREFFRLPEEESRLKTYNSDDPTKTTSFNTSTDKVAANWRDFLRLHCYPIQDYIHDWPTNPEPFRDHTAEYCRSARRLSLQLIEAISESLGLAGDYIGKQLGNHAQHMALNYYPPCPQPDLTYGLPGHKDLSLITVLLQEEVPGLQVLRNGNWVAVDPVPNTFVVNIGDQMQVLSNDRYRSVLHRAVVNCEKERVSIATFYCPSTDAVIGPAPALVTGDEPAVYREFTYGEYYDKFWSIELAKEDCLDMFRVSAYT